MRMQNMTSISDGLTEVWRWIGAYLPTGEGRSHYG